jgi:DNA mismatch endonuclease (patch repair protein)
MPDRHSKDQRSYNMSCIRKFGNASTEARVVSLFRRYGIKGWRRHLALPGRPDFTFRRQKVVVFIDGCFWHHCPRCNWTPATNVAYWRGKFALNAARDRKANRLLRQAGWRVVRIWEHSVKKQHARVMARLLRILDEDAGS